MSRFFCYEQHFPPVHSSALFFAVSPSHKLILELNGCYREAFPRVSAVFVVLKAKKTNLPVNEGLLQGMPIEDSLKSVTYE